MAPFSAWFRSRTTPGSFGEEAGHPKKATTSFKTTRISKTTFLVTENDIYGEHPFIYVKQHPTSHVLIVSDTGCNNPKESVTVSSLREYLETYPIPELDGEPLNPRVKDAEGNIAPERQYIIICTHCHYDHIGGIEAFTALEDTVIVASAYDKKFLTEDLETHFLGGSAKPPMTLPKYEISRWAENNDSLVLEPPKDLRGISATLTEAGITVLWTPGHTPDSLAWYDEAEMVLYTGDSFYERLSSKDNDADMPIIFPKEGNLINFMRTVQRLLRFVRRANGKAEVSAGEEVRDQPEDGDAILVGRRVKIGAAHQTFGRDAEEMLAEVVKLFLGIINGKVPKFFSYPVRGEQNSMWLMESMAQYRVFMPDRLVEDARKRQRIRIA